MPLPCRYSATLTSDQAELLSTIPGIAVVGSEIRCSSDAKAIVARLAPGAVLTQDTPVVRRRLPSSPPTGYACLRSYQKEDARLLATGERDGLWNATGTGKTGVALVAARITGARRVLVVTRAIGRDSWVRDNAWAGLFREVTVLVGELHAGQPTESAARAARKLTRILRQAYPVAGQVEASALLETPGPDHLVVVGWETLAERERTVNGKRVIAVRADLARVNWDVLVMDEHHYAKSGKAARTKAARQLKAKIAWGLTATPVPDRVRDLWVQLQMLDSSAWGRTPWRFMRRYCHAQPGAYGGLDTTGPHLAEEDACSFCKETSAELSERLAGRFTFRTRAEVAAELPAKKREVVRVPRAKNAAARIDRIAAFDDRHGVEGQLALAADAKRETLVELAADYLNTKGKVIVTVNRLAAVGPLAREIRAAVKVRAAREALQVWELTGALDSALRVDAGREYLRAKGPALIVATHQSIAESMDLQSTDALIVGALPLTPREVLQLEGRVSRIGQDRPVTVYYPVAEGTIDEPHLALLMEKLTAADATSGLTEAVNLGATEQDEAEILSRLNQWLAEGDPT